ncbi:MAG: hypothetical protein L3J74_16565 [Bacteroidales bacterium]|nr:hypothetical protein [Bacteroidales bacterium]
MFTNKIKFIFFIIAAFLLINSCTKDVEVPTPDPADRISGRTVRYTVLVVSGANTTFKSTQGIDSAIVSLVMNDSIYSIATDTNGLAAFNNLAAGVAAVTIDYPNHTRANLVVDLSTPSDTGYDANNLRNASTMVALFPLSGEGTATLSGRLFADLDLTNAGLENAPVGIKVSTLIESSQLVNYVNHKGDGEILSISYENAANSTITDNNSDYSIIVPATASGLKIVIQTDDFVYDQIDVGGNPQRKIFHADADTVKVFSGITFYKDIQFN